MFSFQTMSARYLASETLMHHFLSNRDLFTKLGLSYFVFLEDIEVANGVEALFDQTFSSNSLQTLNHYLLPDEIFAGT